MARRDYLPLISEEQGIGSSQKRGRWALSLIQLVLTKEVLARPIFLLSLPFSIELLTLRKKKVKRLISLSNESLGRYTIYVLCKQRALHFITLFSQLSITTKV